MPSSVAPVDLTLGFMPPAHAIADPDHPDLLRAGPRAGAPYGGESVELHRCPATDLCQDATMQADLFELGFDTVDLSPFDALQATFARVLEAGRIDDDDATVIRTTLLGATLTTSTGRPLEVLHVADEGLIMRKAGPNGLNLVGPRSQGMNGHSVATSIHADQDVYGTPLTQMMDGRAPTLFRHHSPDGENRDAGLMLVNLWIPLHQITQPLVLADGRSIDRRSHQLRYGLSTTAFLDRDDEMTINDIWTFLHHPDQRWYFRSELDHRTGYVFDTLSTPHGAGTLPGEAEAERCFRALEGAEAAAVDGDPDALTDALAPAREVALPAPTPPALRAAVETMAALIDDAARHPAEVCGERSEAWRSAATAARQRVVRSSLELRLVVSIPS